MESRNALLNDRSEELSGMLDRWSADDELTMAEAVGILVLKVFELARNAEEEV
jgi:hypothetical protein